MSPLVKIGVPAALLGALATVAVYELALGRRPSGPSEASAPTYAPTAPVTAVNEPVVPPIPAPMFGGPECRCQPGQTFDPTTEECGGAPSDASCSLTDVSEPVRGCDGIFYGHPCQAHRAGVKTTTPATVEELEEQRRVERERLQNMPRGLPGDAPP